VKRSLRVETESWPLRQAFVISRGSRTVAEVVVVTIEEDGLRGRGECVPYRRYGESLESVRGQIESMRAGIGAGMDRASLQHELPAGAARNALDCALWDLDAKRLGRPAWDLAGLDRPVAAVTAFTLSLGSAESMAAEARRHRHRPLLKLKLGADDPAAAVAAVHSAAPGARLIVDANEAWCPRMLADILPSLAEAGVEMIEQPLPASDDDALDGLDSPVPLAADESCHTSADIASLVGRYRIANIKLDKAGGLTEALAMREAALEAGLGIMIGCMVGTSLAMAPAVLLSNGARYVDLDGPLLLAQDRANGLRYYEDGLVEPPMPDLWG
jgi:L-alanine-DL-glutamate epimerase-like enolase superfamily enzyme